MILTFLTFGLSITLILALILGFVWSYIVAIIISGSYMVALIFMILVFKKKQQRHLKFLIFNLGLACKNETDRYYSAHGISLKPGFLGKWLEF
jgi:hypothetical protein